MGSGRTSMLARRKKAIVRETAMFFAVLVALISGAGLATLARGGAGGVSTTATTAQ